MMPTPEPDKKMDDLLRAYARQRRQPGEPPLQLNGATRKLLQEEVRRVLGTKKAAAERKPLWEWLAARWPRLAIGGGVAAALVGLTVMMAPWRSSVTQHAAAPSLSRAPTASAEGAAVRAATPPATAAPVMPATLADNLPTPAPAAAPPPALAAASAPPISEKLSAAGNTLASAPPPAATPAPAASAAAPFVTVRAASDEAAAGQEFVQISNSARALKKGEPVPPDLLSVFQMERRGQNVVVIDSDGSIYNGQVLEPAAYGGQEGLAKDGRAAVPAAGKAWGGPEPAANYSFKVIGVNNKLKQNIVFTGNVQGAIQNTFKSGALRSPRALAGAPAGQSAVVNNSTAAGVALDKQASSNQAGQNRMLQNQAQQNLRVTGKVRVDGGGEFDIEAAPPGP